MPLLKSDKSVLKNRNPLIIFKRSLFLCKTVIFFFLCIALTLPTFPQKNAEMSSDAYVSSGIADARTLIPFFADDTTSSSISNLIYNGLTKIDKDLNIVSDLAENWKIEEDGLSITFYLKRNVLWHDGKPFTSRDVHFTFKTILDPKTGCPYISNFSDISDIEVIDEYTIRFRYKRPYAPALLKFGMGIIPEHLFKDIDDIRASVYASGPIGTGPYRLSKWKKKKYQ